MPHSPIQVLVPEPVERKIDALVRSIRVQPKSVRRLVLETFAAIARNADNGLRCPELDDAFVVEREVLFNPVVIRIAVAYDFTKLENGSIAAEILDVVRIKPRTEEFDDLIEF